jgi:hypothetical protein
MRIRANTTSLVNVANQNRQTSMGSEVRSCVIDAQAVKFPQMAVPG